MRTAIYVHHPSTVTIVARDPRDAKVLLCRYNQLGGEPAVGKHALVPGIYLVISAAELEVTGLHIDLEAVHNDKDQWPDPKENVIGLEPGASAASIREFATIAKDVSPHG